MPQMDDSVVRTDETSETTNLVNGTVMENSPDDNANPVNKILFTEKVQHAIEQVSIVSSNFE